ncbi:MAG TPA: serine protease [Blastocatellia bacterium]|nr:serine protease [Blastocatellia bacterium]
MTQNEGENRFLSVLPGIKAATVMIGLPPEQLDDQTPGMGTGFLVAETGLILTNRHVVEPHLRPEAAQWLRVWLPGPVKPVPYRVEGQLLDPRHDLCLLWIEDDGRLPAPLTIAWDYQVREGESVALCGYPYGFTNLFNRERPGLRGVNSIVQRAIVSALWPSPAACGGEVTMMQLDALTNPGNSGGPVFVPSTGEVVGVLTGFLQNRVDGQVLNTGISEALPIHCLRDLMRRWRERGPDAEA